MSKYLGGGCRRHRLVQFVGVVAAALAFLVFALANPASAKNAKIALAVSLSGNGGIYGPPLVNAARLAIEESSAEGGPTIELSIFDDHSNGDEARENARQAAASDALVVVGPQLTTSSLAAGPIFAAAGLVSIVPTAHGDDVNKAATTFRAVFSNSEAGAALAVYLRQVLGGNRAVVIFRNDGFGRPIAEGFSGAAATLGISAVSRAFVSSAERDEAVRLAAADPDKPAIILGMLGGDAEAALIALRRNGAAGLILGPSAISGEVFGKEFAKEPEEQREPGFFTNGVYATAPIMIDSGNAATLAFAERYRRRFGQEPDWAAAQGYDGMRLAIAAVQAAGAATGAGADLKAKRAAVAAYLASLDSPANAVASLSGPLWFTPDRGRELPVRIGRFRDALFESAPLQLVPASNPSPAEIASGALVDTGNGRYARRQQVVYTGIFVNEISRIDIAPSTFTADFYLWLRFVKVAGSAGSDVTEIDFPDLVRGTFDPKKPAVTADLDDGTTYRLWWIRGDFKNDFDLHHYPLDRQRLLIRLFNARAASDRIVYVQDRRSVASELQMPGQPSMPNVSADGGNPIVSAAAAGPAVASAAIAAGNTAELTAFRNLTQWEPLSAHQLRDILVTQSALGDPRLVGVERIRELSGYRVEVDLTRRTVATLAKTLLPLGLMTLIMFASLYFPHALVKEKITVVITAALSSAVLLAAVNTQLGSLGYTIAVEYVFYIFFTLCLLCILSVLAAERLRGAQRGALAEKTELGTRALFLITVAATIAAAAAAAAHW